jgi:hypothetical protein
VLFCAHCDTAMMHTYTAKGPRRYRYYVCYKAQQKGWQNCKTKSVAAEAIEGGRGPQQHSAALERSATGRTGVGRSGRAVQDAEAGARGRTGVHEARPCPAQPGTGERLPYATSLPAAIHRSSLLMFSGVKANDDFKISSTSNQRSQTQVPAGTMAGSTWTFSSRRSRLCRVCRNNPSE